MIKVFAFDVFGTLINMEGVPREELEAYGEHIRKPVWYPLVLPESWKTLKPFDDVADGLYDLEKLGAYCVTLSNAPAAFQVDLWDNNWLYAGSGINFFVPLEMLGVFKPNSEAYNSLLRLFPDVRRDEFCMVSANKHFGDLEAARSLGMKAVLIRGDTGIDVSHLAEMAERGEM